MASHRGPSRSASRCRNMYSALRSNSSRSLMEMPGPMEAMEAMEAMSLVNAGPGVFNGTRPSSRKTSRHQQVGEEKQHLK